MSVHAGFRAAMAELHAVKAAFGKYAAESGDRDAALDEAKRELERERMLRPRITDEQRQAAYKDGRKAMYDEMTASGGATRHLKIELASERERRERAEKALAAAGKMAAALRHESERAEASGDRCAEMPTTTCDELVAAFEAARKGG